MVWFSSLFSFCYLKKNACILGVVDEMEKGARGVEETLMHFSLSQMSIAVNNFKHTHPHTHTQNGEPGVMFSFPVSLCPMFLLCVASPQMLSKTLITFKS